MPDIKPFCGLRYNPEKTTLATVVAPPYDVISSGYQEELYERDDYNVVRLILGKSADRYKEAATCLDTWQRERVLIRDDEPGIYVLSQSFKGQSGNMIQRAGFIAACRLVEFGEGVVLPHEKTLSKPKEDRFKLMQATNTNFSQIFGIFQDSEKVSDRLLSSVMADTPIAEVMFEKVINRLWRVTDNGIIGKLTELMRSRPVLIADGHHRYETALAYRDLQRIRSTGLTGEEPFNFVMMFFASMDSEGLVIFPTHRIVHSLSSFDEHSLKLLLSKHYSITSVASEQELLDRLGSMERHAFGVITKGERYVIRLKSDGLLVDVVGSDLAPDVRDLDVTLLHAHIIGSLLGVSQQAQELKQNLDYVKEPAEAAEAVRSGKAQLAFIMNPTRIEQVRNVARAGHTMPQKSTYFYPKLVSGLVMNKLD